MWKRLLPLAVLAVAAALVIVAIERSEVRDGVTPAPAVRIATDLTHDVDRIGLTLTRLPPDEEMRVGDRIAKAPKLAPEDLPTQAYLERVGGRLAALAVRKGIRYRIHYLPDRNLVNAFALPGGHVYVGKGLFSLIESEAELASVIAHEIQHVDQRHSIERLQYELAARRLGLGNAGALLAQLGTALFQAGYRKDQELDADRLAVAMCAQLGYNPAAGAEVFRRMQARSAQFEVPPRPRSPVRETAQVLAASLEEYFRSHPRYDERISQIMRLSAGYPGRDWIENRDEFLRYCRP